MDELIETLACAVAAAAIYFVATFFTDRSLNLGLSRFARRRIRKLGKSAVAVVNHRRSTTKIGIEMRILSVEVRPMKGAPFSAEIGIPESVPLFRELDDDDDVEDDDEHVEAKAPREKEKVELPVIYVPGDPKAVIVDYDEVDRRKQIAEEEEAMAAARRKAKKKKRHKNP